MRPVHAEVEAVIAQYQAAKADGGSRYVRIGECKRCGKCCELEECQHFIPATKSAVATCKIHGSTMELKCILFPEAPPILIKECGYRFKDTLDGIELGVREI